MATAQCNAAAASIFNIFAARKAIFARNILPGLAKWCRAASAKAVSGFGSLHRIKLCRVSAASPGKSNANSF